MISKNLLKELEKIVGKAHVSASPMDLKAYAFVRYGADIIGMKPADIIVLPKILLRFLK
jgi:hypothetical protein